MKSVVERFTPSGWSDYELIDSGNGEKLERFGDVTVIRPEVTAIWSPQLSSKEWRSLAHARFEQDGARSGKWHHFKKHPDHWSISFPLGQQRLVFNLRFTSFKHLGVFPEQAANWNYIQEQCRSIKTTPKVLNLFAYTGGASLAAKACGAEVTHVDSIRQVIDWTRENMEASRLNGIRWVVEDALRFAEREAKRGNRYHGIIMDPPSWGISPGKGQKKWRLEDQIHPLLKATSSILEDQHFVVLNTYSGLAAATLETMTSQYFNFSKITVGELVNVSTTKQVLATGTCLRGSC